jgi:hypothetical protein
MQPAVVEVLGPAPHMLCAEHAAVELANTEQGWAHEEGWETYGAEAYARHCERAVEALEAFAITDGSHGPSDDNPVLGEVLEEAINYLEEYELERARRALERRGGERILTSREQATIDFFKRRGEGPAR